MSNQAHSAVGTGWAYRPVFCGVLALAMLSITSGCQWAGVGQNVDGTRHYNAGNFPAAADRFRQAMQSDPQNPDSYYNLGMTYHRQGMLRNNQDDLDQAERFYDQCLQRDLNHRDGHRALAVLLVERGDAEGAQDLLESWVERSPSSADAKLELARLKTEFGEREAAIEYLTDALEDDPNHQCALTALGTMREQMGDHKQALACYQRSLRANRFQPQVQNRVASLQRRLAPNSIITPAGGTRLVEGPTTKSVLR